MDNSVGQWRDEVAAVLSEHYTDDRLFVLDPRTHRMMETTLSKDDLANFDSIVFDWRMRAVQIATQVVFWFAAGFSDDAAMLELGIAHLRGDRIIVGCDPRHTKFWTIREFCERFQIPFKTEVADLGVLARYRL